MKASTPTRDYIGQSISGGLKTNSKSFCKFLWEAETRWKGSELQQGITSSFTLGSWQIISNCNSTLGGKNWAVKSAYFEFCKPSLLLCWILCCLRLTCANCETLFPTTDGALFSKVLTYNLNQSSVSENFLQGDIFVNNVCVLWIYDTI